MICAQSAGRSAAVGDNTAFLLTGCGLSKGALTRQNSKYSPIHTPYYHYSSSFKKKAARGKGSTCAYSS